MADEVYKKDPADTNVPRFISNAPWYVEGEVASSKKVDYEPEKSDKNEWYVRGEKAGPAAKKFRKGACENCGAMSHKLKDCLERPRKIKAKFNNKDIMADEVVRDVSLGYEAKRDRWNGYEPSMHQLVVEEYEQRDEKRQKLKGAVEPGSSQKADKGEFDIAELSSSDDSEDEEKYAEKMHVPASKVDTFTRTTVRNLRIREDTAKYLKNIHSNDDEYDPKTRSFKSGTTDSGEFVKYTGETPRMLELQVFSWDSSNRGIDLNLQADPTKAALLHKEYQKKKNEVKHKIRNDLVDKYGVSQPLPAQLVPLQSDVYVEYAPSGERLMSGERALIRSRYEEDLCTKYAAGHTTVWGSYFDATLKRWGYSCCKCLNKRKTCLTST